MRSNANAMGPSHSVRAGDDVPDLTNVVPELVYGSGPAVSPFDYVISEPRFLVSGFGPAGYACNYLTLEPGPADSSVGFPSPYAIEPAWAIAPPSYFNALNLYGQGRAFCSSSLPDKTRPWDFGAGSWSPFPGSYCGLQSVGEYYESLATAILPIEYAGSGQLLNEYEAILDSLRAIIKSVQTSFDLNTWAAYLRKQAIAAGYFEEKKFDFQEVIEVINVAQAPAYSARASREFAYSAQPAPVLAYILFERRTRRIRERIWNKVQRIKRVLYQTQSRFCGLSWSRRSWFLLHGSHPPKTEFWTVTSPEFGCA